MSWARGKSPGWAAFNLKQQNSGLQDEIDQEPFPPMSTALSSLPPRDNLHRVNGHSGRSFSSAQTAPLPSANSLTSSENFGAKKTIHGDSSIQSGKKVVEETTHELAFWKLKELHSWADFSLIVDIMEAVNNNFNEASTLLKTMVSSDNFKLNNEMSTLGLHSSNDLLGGKSPGWAAFNLNQQNRGLQDEIDPEPFRPRSTAFSSLPPRENLRVNGRSGRSFSSPPLPSANSLTSPENFGAKKTILGDSSIQSAKKVVQETTDELAFWKLKELHSWADFSLIVQIMEAVNNNFNEASTLLKTMVSSDNFELNNEMSTLGLHSSNDLSGDKSPGWAAFNLNQQNRGLQDEIDPEPFRPMSTAFSSLPPRENLHRVNGPSGRSFSSAPLPSANSLTSPENFGAKKTILGDSSIQSAKKVVQETTDELAFWKLKELHSWADFSLIVHIMEAVNNNFNEASTLLKTMVSSDNFEINNEMSILGLHSSNDLSCNGKNDVSISLENTVNIPILSSTLKDVQDVHQNNNACEEDYKKLFENNYGGRNFFHNVGNPKLALGCSKSVPIEPEWEEDDIYLSHRKDAIAMMRSASQHSRAATNAYLRKDHASAKYHSSRAQEQGLAAKMLNDKAANEILRTRNSDNGLWKLDLHGLHAAEAVQALQEHLLKIETQNASNRSLSPKKAGRKGFQRASSLEYLSCMDSKLDKDSPSSRHRPTSLEVITGIGKHSRGEAALPKAVTSFLGEKGYRFEQLRPGTINVRPKFRR